MGEYYSVKWENGVLKMLDQRLLPHQVLYREYKSCGDVSSAISQMIIRGAPAIGIAAGYALALCAYYSQAKQIGELLNELNNEADRLRKSRPTAVNLFSAINRIMQLIEHTNITNVEQIKQMVVAEAQKIADEDVQMNKNIGVNGEQFIPDNANIIHHCNTGALATGGYGTAIGVIRAAHEKGKKIHVYVDETRPLLQGSRLTSWELKQLGIPHTIIVDGASGYLMHKMKIDACLVGCDRIAANGDVANKIGTYNLALVASAHNVPFYVVGPLTTVDLSIKSGDDIQIEERSDQEITHMGDLHIAPDGIDVENPAFDITPAKYITAIITNAGVALPPFDKALALLLNA